MKYIIDENNNVIRLIEIESIHPGGVELGELGNLIIVDGNNQQPAYRYRHDKNVTTENSWLELAIKNKQGEVTDFYIIDQFSLDDGKKPANVSDVKMNPERISDMNDWKLANIQKDESRQARKIAYENKLDDLIDSLSGGKLTQLKQLRDDDAKTAEDIEGFPV